MPVLITKLFNLDNVNAKQSVSILIQLLFLVNSFKDLYREKQILMLVNIASKCLAWTSTCFLFSSNCEIISQIISLIFTILTIQLHEQTMFFICKIIIQTINLKKKCNEIIVIILVLGAAISSQTITQTTFLEYILTIFCFFILTLFEIVDTKSFNRIIEGNNLIASKQSKNIGFFKIENKKVNSFTENLKQILNIENLKDLNNFINEKRLFLANKKNFFTIGKESDIQFNTSRTENKSVLCQESNTISLCDYSLKEIIVEKHYDSITFQISNNIYKVKIIHLLSLNQATLDIVYIYQKQNQNLERERFEQIIQRQQEQINYIAHEIRNPLSAILNYSECLKQQLNEEDIQNLVNPIQFAGQLVLSQVNDLLDFGQIQTGTIRIVKDWFSLKKFLKQTIKIFQIQSQQKQIVIKTSYQSIIPETIFTDLNRLRQIIINLVSNALKFTKPQGVIQIVVEEYNQNILTFKIIDSGIGISQENIQKLFKSFSKINDEQQITMNPSGVGLGLIISWKLSLLLGGTDQKGIKVFSQQGVGSTFQFEVDISNIENQARNMYDYSAMSSKKVIYYPNQLSVKFFQDYTKEQNQRCSISQKDKNQKQLSPYIQDGIRDRKQSIDATNMFNSMTLNDVLARKKSSYSKMNSHTYLIEIPKTSSSPILIVDDEVFNQIPIQILLNQQQLKSDTAVNGEQAIQLIETQMKLDKYYRLIIIDYSLPDMTGVECIRKIKQILPSFLNYLIVGLTGYSDSKVIEEFRELDIHDCLTKPLLPKQLKKILNELKESLQ